MKIYKNPDRNKVDNYKPYVPQYQVYDKTPSEYHGAVVSSDTPIARPSPDNPRIKKPALRQPYAVTTATTSPIGRGKGPVPNVGNNMEHTWSSVDGDIVDDLSDENIDPNHIMIDNNEFVTDQALGFKTGLIASELQPINQGKVSFEEESMAKPKIYEIKKESVIMDLERNSEKTDELLFILNDLSDNVFLLIVAGVPVCSGPKEEIEDQARALVFGEHEMCEGNPISIDDIIILKRVKVKVGLFLE